MAKLRSRVFIGYYPTGIVFADRWQEEHGDYKAIAFLPYRTRVLELRDSDHELLADIRRWANQLTGAPGELVHADNPSGPVWGK